MPKKPAKGQSLGERIRTMRERQGVRIEQLAHKTGYAPEYLQEIEDGKVSPPVGGTNSDIQRACRGLCLPARGGEKERARKELH